jgi:hypothetical protein
MKKEESNSSYKKPHSPTGRILVIHANGKPYGRGAGGSKASNRNFPFSASDYEKMRDSGRPYSGNPTKNKLLPLPRPTYTEFINRAKRAKMAARLDFLYVPSDQPQPPPISFNAYERVVWSGVSFRRFSRIWTPERNHFFCPEFRARAMAVFCCAHRQRADRRLATTAHLGSLPAAVLQMVMALSAAKGDARREEFDGMDVVCSGAKHLFLPAPGSSGVREMLFDAAFGLQ